MTRHRGLIIALGLTLSVSACVGWMPRRKASPDIGRSLPAGASGGSTSSVSSKAVYGKREPVTIIAQDRTECIVSEKKFKELATGEKVLCAWRTP